MRKIKIAITGAYGFLGTYLVRCLKRRNDLELVLFDKNKNNLFNGASLKSFLKEADIVVHLAGANRDSDFNLVKTNLLGTVGLLEGIIRYSPKAKIIFSSSFQTYDEKSPYGLSKKLAEDAIFSFSRIYGVKSIILRISNIYGKDGKPFYNSVIATFAYLTKNKKPIVVNGTGEQKRDYIYIEDVADAITKAILYNPARLCEYFDICSGELTSLNQIVRLLRQICHSKEVKIDYNKNYEENQEEVKRSYLKAKDHLSWQPRLGIKEGLMRILS